MNQITASVSTEYDERGEHMVTHYTTTCGCAWQVDHWGNVRSCWVCRKCMQVPRYLEDQVELF